jgi:DNA-directed RNA polymerase subunit N (RpoN/RPB10)
MIVPMRCFTCGREISRRWKEYNVYLDSGYEEG